MLGFCEIESEAKRILCEFEVICKDPRVGFITTICSHKEVS